jgi:D-amino peptidase
MKVVIWGDMEGIAGISSWEQVTGGNPQYESEGRLLYTEEINAAVRGAKAGGAAEIIAVDGHGAGGGNNFNSWLKDRLEPGADYVCGHRWGCHVDPFQSGFDALRMVGAHARAGAPEGVLSHTISSSTWYEASLNGTRIGETALAAAIVGSFGVPLVFVAGDAATAAEVRQLVGAGVTTVEVKQGLARFASRFRAPREVRDLIEKGVAQALGNRANWPKPFNPGTPVELRVEYLTPDKVEQHRGKSGVEVVGERTVISRADNAWNAWNQFFPRG